LKEAISSFTPNVPFGHAYRPILHIYKIVLIIDYGLILP